MLNSMKIQENISLKDFSTMRLGGLANYLTEVNSEEDLLAVIQFARQKNTPIKVLGGGSNVIFTDDGFSGIVIINQIKGFEIESDGDDYIVEIGSGEIWDDCVAKTVELGLTGIEALSLIPGTAGGTPVQNVGAYGQEIKDTLVNVRAYDLQTNTWVTIDNSDCEFAYRKSIFNSSQRNRYIITKIRLKLSKSYPRKPFYKSVQEYFDEHGIDTPTPTGLRNAVIAIRSAKLPDPKILANSGSFFHNPVIARQQFDSLAANYPDIPHYSQAENVKIPAAWLIEQVGLKNHRDPSGLATYDKQPLVIVNYSAQSENDLVNFKKMIIDKVFEKFKIKLEQEPETVYNLL